MVVPRPTLSHSEHRVALLPWGGLQHLGGGGTVMGGVTAMRKVRVMGGGVLVRGGGGTGMWGGAQCDGGGAEY